MQAQNKRSGKIYVVAESRLPVLPSEAQKVNVANGSMDKPKSSNAKSKGSGGKKEKEEAPYEVLDKFSGATLVGMK